MNQFRSFFVWILIGIFVLSFVSVILHLFYSKDKSPVSTPSSIAYLTFSFQAIAYQKTEYPEQPMEWIEKIEAPVIGACIAGLIGFLTALRVNVIQRRRERETRKRNFIGHAAMLRSIIERIDPEKVECIWSKYLMTVHQFHAEKMKVWGDFQPVEDFDGLCNAFGCLKHEQIITGVKGHPTKILTEALDEITKFCKTH